MADHRDPMQAFEDELGAELFEVVMRNAAARREGRHEDVNQDRQDLLVTMFLPPRPDKP